MASAVVAPDAAKDSAEGIGILKFLEGKTYFITGATGLLAKAFVEKILREAPNTRKIFVLVKANDKEKALNRVMTEIVHCALFKRLKELHGDNYEDFMMSKLVPVVGNMCKPNLGITNNKLAARMFEEIDVIVNSAANTKFHERYDVSLNINTQGPFRVLCFALRCKKLRLFLHVSTAYVNGERQGVVMEKPFFMGQSIAGEKRTTTTSGTDDLQASSLPQLDVHAEIKLASQMAQDLAKDELERGMRELGLNRARMFGWQDTYVFTKAMGEMMISSYKRHIPVAIIRPSIIESTYREPFPGWIQGNRMLDPLIICYGKGLLPGYLADPEARIDIVPLDMVVNTMVSVMAKHGSQFDSNVNVYQISSSVINPLEIGEMLRFLCDYYKRYPLKDSRGHDVSIEGIKFFSSLAEFSAYIQHELSEKMGLGEEAASSNPKTLSKIHVTCKRTLESLIYMAKLFQPYAFYKGWFYNGNTQKLMMEMSPNELEAFPLDLHSINWKHYFVNIHVQGLKRHVLRGGGSMLEEEKRLSFL